jgi:hypothetical protein
LVSCCGLRKTNARIHCIGEGGPDGGSCGLRKTNARIHYLARKCRPDWRLRADGPLEKQELLRLFLRTAGHFSKIHLHLSELYFGDGQQPNLAFIWQTCSHLLPVSTGNLFAGAVSSIDGKLQHAETAANQILAEPRGLAAILSRLDWKIEQSK